jgi:hypothetical protein
VPAVVILSGLACGTLLAAAGLALWDGLRQVAGLSRGVQVIGWLAGTLLLIGALLAWQGGSLSAPTPHLILMAAVAAPPGIRHRRPSRWSNAVRILPALVLAGAGLLDTLQPAGPEVDSSPVALVELLVVICGGLGTRALSQSLSEIAASSPQVEWPSAAAYALLTLLVGGMAAANLWQRGTAWRGTATESGLAGAWLAWSAARLSPRQPSRLRPMLTAVAALVLIMLAVGC